MAITRTGVQIATEPTFTVQLPLDFSIEGGQVGQNAVPVTGLSPDTTYYAKAYFEKDGVITRQRDYREFRTEGGRVLKLKNAYAGYNNISLLKSGSPSAISLDYSTDRGTTWTTWNSSSGTYLNANLPENGELWLKGENYRINNSNSAYWYFTSEHIFDCEGSLGAIIDRNTSIIPDYCFCRLFYNTAVRTAPDIPAMYLANSCFYFTFLDCTSLTSAPALPATTMAASCYRGMFQGCTSLVNAPSLPATAIADYCYYAMFQGCTSLVNAPSLPATTLAASCYTHLFYGCTSLVTTPSLPATTLYINCYAQMFYGCTSLTGGPSLPATTLAANCFKEMFRGCTSLVNAPALPATTMAESCYYGMLMGCTSLVNAPALPATTLASSCYQNLFSGCTSLTAAPALPATTLASSCYNTMFGGCTSLTAAPALPATTPITGCYTQMFKNCSSLVQIICYATTWNTAYASNWVSGVAASGDFYNLGGATIPTDNVSGVPIGWTLRTELANYLTFTNTANEDNSISLIRYGLGSWIIEYSTDGINWTSATVDTYGGTFGVTLHPGEYVKLRGNNGGFNTKNNYAQFRSTTYCEVSGDINTLLNKFGGDVSIPNNGGFYRLFKDMAYLENGGLVLPSTTLGISCYEAMFENCRSMTTAPALPATTLVDSCYLGMFRGCTSLVNAPALPATTLATECYHAMFWDCTALTTAPVLPATTLADSCYTTMFRNCSSLNKIICYATTWNTAYASSWVNDVASSGDFYNLGGANIPIDSDSGVPIGWTSHTDFGDALIIRSVSDAAQNEITLTKYGTPNDITLEYSTDDGTTWTTWSSANSDLDVIILAGETLKLRGNNSTFSNRPDNVDGGFYHFGSSAEIAVSGNMMALLSDNVTTLPSYCFAHAFDSAPVTTVSSDLLPATSLGRSCYQSMFYGCTELINTPTLPATTLVQACYQSMFSLCTSLTQVPELPATTLADSCYSGMFSGCTSLASVPSDLLHATTLAWYCYSGMFSGCTSLTTSPVLPATAMTDYCYVNMFNGCTSLNSITTYAQSWNITNSRDWVLDVSATGDFYDLGGANIPAYSSGMNRGSGRPYGWTVHTSL